MLGNLLQRRLDRAGDVETRALGGRSCTPVSSAETNPASDLAQEKIHLGLDPSGARIVATRAKILQLRSEFGDSTLVLPLGFGVEHLARVAESADADGVTAKQRDLVRTVGFASSARARTIQKIQRMEFFAGMLQQPLNIAETLNVLQRKAGAAVADGPVFAAAHECSGLSAGSRR
ncbi:MAG TPA: hypothetical protein VN865_16270 [Candidatus Acidoferrales bacterium]|nr:hypothetical protein [Candidatus Acidoferrales bacterium]